MIYFYLSSLQPQFCAEKEHCEPAMFDKAHKGFLEVILRLSFPSDFHVS